ncbi:MAG: winged helix-turn-helix domain-containing protein [Candidatus Marinimicrobia bacterium]|nr:winged helix-turn-helix domain-containing protein [Candidatus Neomarinimicrobiota bacterium]
MRIEDGRQLAYAWQEKSVLRMIRAHYDASKRVTGGIAAYTALTEKASNTQSDDFEATQGDLARLAGMHRNTISSYLEDFEDLKIMAVERRKIGNANMPSIYRLLPCPLTGQPAQVDEKPVVHNTEESLELDICFEQFWAKYPKKKSKKPALKSFQKINPDDALLSTMLDALETQKLTNDWSKEGGQFIPLPVTWLNQARWEDEVPEQKVHADESEWNPL